MPQYTVSFPCVFRFTGRVSVTASTAEKAQIEAQMVIHEVLSQDLLLKREDGTPIVEWEINDEELGTLTVFATTEQENTDRTAT
jgi:hypothetical protein